VPYGRVAVAPVDAEGRPIHAVGESATKTASGVAVAGSTRSDLAADTDSAARRLGWGVSLFGAAEDAALARPWSRNRCGGAESWRTQGRRLALAAALLSLTGADGPPPPDAGLLGVPALTRLESTAAYASAASAPVAAPIRSAAAQSASRRSQKREMAAGRQVSPCAAAVDGSAISPAAAIHPAPAAPPTRARRRRPTSVASPAMDPPIPAL